MSTAFETESDLIEAMAAERDDAFREAIRRYQSPMMAVAMSLVGDKLADEVVQEAWLSALRAIGSFEQRSSLKTWLLRIVANEGKTRLRRENRQTSLDAMLEVDPYFRERFDSTGHWTAAPAAWEADTPEALLTRDELQHCIEQTMMQLPGLQQAALNLRERQGMSMKELCNILEVSESNVRVLLHRARMRVFRTIEHFETTGECQPGE